VRPLHPMLISLACSSQISLLQISPGLSESVRETEEYEGGRKEGRRERRREGRKDERKKERKKALSRDGLVRK